MSVGLWRGQSAYLREHLGAACITDQGGKHRARLAIIDHIGIRSCRLDFYRRDNYPAWNRRSAVAATGASFSAYGEQGADVLVMGHIPSLALPQTVNPVPRIVNSSGRHPRILAGLACDGASRCALRLTSHLPAGMEFPIRIRRRRPMSKTSSEPTYLPVSNVSLRWRDWDLAAFGT